MPDSILIMQHDIDVLKKTISLMPKTNSKERLDLLNLYVSLIQKLREYKRVNMPREYSRCLICEEDNQNYIQEDTICISCNICSECGCIC